MTEPTPSFAGLRVAAFESRRAGEMASLIERFGGQPLIAPALRETPLEQNPQAVDFAHRLITGEVSVVVFLTGVGFRYLLETVARHVDRQRYLDALADITTIARGPKPVASMKEVGLQPTFRVPEPNTWRELLATVDAHVPVANQTVALQEYGKPNASLVAGLEARGATVLRVPVYQWQLPADLGPLEAAVRALSAGTVHVVLFTSAQQVVHVLETVRRLGEESRLREHWNKLVVASIGPTTSETLTDCDLRYDVEAEPPKMGHLVAAAARWCSQRRTPPPRVGVQPQPAAAPGSAPPRWYDGPFLRACRGEACRPTPIWLMRQAGRYMPEYRQIRDRTTFLELCKNPVLCSEVMCTAVERLGVDAAIIFSDLLPILEPMGLELEFAPGEGPHIHNPVREARDVDRVLELEQVDALEFVFDTVRRTRADLPPHIPLIGFAGAPFTLASYTIEGGGSRDFAHTKTLMFRDAGAWDELMQRLARSVTRYLAAQIAAGAQCVQLFDSWAGCLGPDDYRRYVLPYVQQVTAGLPADTPVISFATGNPALLPLLAAGGARVVGVDWRVRLDVAWQAIGDGPSVQGNLDPCVLFADRDEIRTRARDILNQAAGRPGHIFNLGHGVLPATPVDNAVALVDAVHEMTA